MYDVDTHCVYLFICPLGDSDFVGYSDPVESDPALTLRRYIRNTQYADINCISCIIYVYTSRYDCSNKKEAALKKGPK